MANMTPEATRLFRDGETILTNDRVFLRDRAGLGSLATQNGTFSGNSSGTNTGDQDLSAYLTQTSASTTYLTISAASVYLTSAAAISYYQPKDAGLTSLSSAPTVGTFYYLSAFDVWQPVTIGANLTFVAGTLAATGGGGGGSAEFVTAPLTGFNDSRGAIGAHCYEPLLGQLSLKVSTSPHQWVSWFVTNSTT